LPLAKSAQRVALDNLNQPAAPALSEEENAFAENFLHQMLLTLPLLGFWQFTAEESDDLTEDESAQEAEAEASTAATTGKRAALYSTLPKGLQFTLTFKGALATLVVVEGGVQVQQGSVLVDPPSERFEVDAPSYAALRRQLVEAGVISNANGKLSFVQDPVLLLRLRSSRGSAGTHQQC
jgi:hypothetical protein